MARTTESTVKRPSGGDVRTGMTPESLSQAVADHLRYTIGRLPAAATRHDYYRALALAVRDRMQDRWTRTTLACLDQGRKVACYLSAEFLLGPHLGNNLSTSISSRRRAGDGGARAGSRRHAGVRGGAGTGQRGPRPAGRLLPGFAGDAADRPAIGYGIRYEFGIFDQEIRDGWQVEVTDKWLRYGNPWEIAKPEVAYYGELGRPHRVVSRRRRRRARALGARPRREGDGVRHADPGLPRRPTATRFDCGAPRRSSRSTSRPSTSATTTVPWTRSWSPRPSPRCSIRTTSRRAASGCGSRSSISSCRVRCRTCCTRSTSTGVPVSAFAERFAVQLNDTHPSIAVAELMRLLVDERHLDWEAAWAHHRRHVRLHEPHAAARGARDVAVADVRRAAAASPRDHLRDQPPLSRRGAGAISR